MAAPTQNPDTQARCLSRGTNAGSLKVSSWAATTAVTVNPAQAPGTGPTPLPTGESVRCSVCVHLCGCLVLLSSVHWVLNITDSSLMTLDCIPKLGVGYSKVAERIYLPSIWVAGGYSLWPLDGD